MLTRRRFLLGTCLAGITALSGLEIAALKAAAPALLRPPGALPEKDFLATCIRCGLCLEACPYRTLLLATPSHGVALGTPYIYARRMPCYLCQGYKELKCIAICPTGALRPVATWRKITMGTAVIDRNLCLAWQGILCRACWHACPLPGEAIELDELGRALINAEKCIGCGICEYVCITDPSSITVVPHRSL